jgi:hypothetical protein
MTVPLAGRAVPVLFAAVVAAGAVVLGAMLLAPVLARALVDWSPGAQEALFSLLLYGLLALVAVVGRKLARLTGGGSASAGRWIALGVAIGVGGLMLTLGYATLAGAVARGAGVAGAGMLLFGSVVMVGQAASEELFFRGWIQPVLARAWHPALAILVTALAFAALHVAGGARTPLTLVNLLLGGILFGLLAWRSGGLAASIAAHAGWNWSEGIVFGLDPNPGAGSFGAVHDLDLIGASLWGGSGEGLNASIAMTIVLVAFIVPVAAAALPARRITPAAPAVSG